MPTELLYEELTYRIRKSVFKVYNTLGFGHKENVYCKALAIEFGKDNIEFKQEQAVDVLYDNQKIGVYKPDFVIDNIILLEIKALSFMGKDPETQMVYYLKGTNYKLGLLINFGANKLDIRRRIWTGSVTN